MADGWISAETEEKEQHFHGILKMHLQICRSIEQRYRCPPYLYADLHAGPGQLRYGTRDFLGSPLIFTELANAAGISYQPVFFEQDPATAARLHTALSPTLFVGEGDSCVRVERSEDGLPTWLKEIDQPARRQGLVYADPIGKEIPYDTLAAAARVLPKVDLLSYVSATSYKRAGWGPLVDHIRAVGKQYALVREPKGAQQWTFILWTNWAKFPEWRRIGLYRADSPKGKQILDRLNFTDRELRRATNTPLPFDDDAGVPYRTYAEYLRHPRFKEIRAEVFARAAGSCERCEQRPPTEPHHLRYPPWGTFDVPENMIAVCHQCHCTIHGKAS